MDSYDKAANCSIGDAAFTLGPSGADKSWMTRNLLFLFGMIPITDILERRLREWTRSLTRHTTRFKIRGHIVYVTQI